MTQKLVRCLGPDDEHWFYSRDPCRNRICAKCKAKMAYTKVAKTYTSVVIMPKSDKKGSA